VLFERKDISKPGEKGLSKRTVSGITLTLLIIGMLILTFNIQPVEASGTIYIRADGSIDPPTAPISTVDNVTYVFTDNVDDSIVVERDNIIIDGDSRTLQVFGTAIDLSYRCNVTIRKTKIITAQSGGYTGIFLSHSYNNLISENSITNNFCSVLLNYSSNNLISENSMTNNFYNIAISYSSNNLISRNNLISNEFGLMIECSSNNTISRNSMTNNFLALGLGASSNNNTISRNNIMNNPHSIGLDTAFNSTIYGNNITNNTAAPISLYKSFNSTIYGNNITNNNGYGICLDESHNNLLFGNNLISNGWYGIDIRDGSSNNDISENNIRENNGGGIRFYYSASSNNSISGNHIYGNNGEGILFYYCGKNLKNTIFENNITSNLCGIRFVESSENIIYHNNFLDNTEQVHIDPFSEYPNRWDDGYPSGGNYWSDYVGVDEKSGPNQNQPGTDGIGDTHYIITDDNHDKYPLMVPWGLADVAITNIVFLQSASSPRIIILVSVVNRGNTIEAFNVSVNWTRIYPPPHLTGQLTPQSVELSPRESIVIAFTWIRPPSPSRFQIYEMKAYTGTIPNDINPMNNIKIAYLRIWKGGGGAGKWALLR
jgi:parallel beta-helix repeat protein